MVCVCMFPSSNGLGGEASLDACDGHGGATDDLFLHGFQVGLLDKCLAEFVVGVGSDSKGGKDPEASGKAGLAHVGGQAGHSLGGGGRGSAVKVHGVNVDGRRDELGDDGDSEGASELGHVGVDLVLGNEVLGRLGCSVEGGRHGGRVSDSKEPHGAQGHLGGRLAGSAEFARENGVAPHEQSHVGKGGGPHFQRLALLLLDHLVLVQQQLAQVGHGVGAKVDHQRQAKGQTAKELARLRANLDRLRAQLSNKGSDALHGLHDGLVDDGHQWAHQERGGSSAGNFFGCALLPGLRKVVRFGAGVDQRKCVATVDRHLGARLGYAADRLQYGERIDGSCNEKMEWEAEITLIICQCSNASEQKS
eukprot:scaffold1697_cov40-Attheya_sp.AAC.1